MIENQNLIKLKGYINIAHKAGYLILGTDNLKQYQKKLYLLVYAGGAGHNLIKVALNCAERTNASLIKLPCDDLSELTSVKNCKIFGIKNKGLQEKIEEILRSEAID